MITKLIATPLVAGLLTLVGPCDPPPPPHVVCHEEGDGWTRCRRESDGIIVVAFPTVGLWCPTEDSCDVDRQKDATHEGYVIRPVVP